MSSSNHQAELDDASEISCDAHLAVDLGASSGRVIAGGLQDQKMVMATISRFPNGPVKVQQNLIWNHLSLWQSILDGLRQSSCEISPTRIRSIGVDTWGVDYALLDAQDQMISPMRHYRDHRNEGMVEKAFETLGRGEIFAATGLQFMQINTLYQLIAAQQHQDHALNAADGFLMAADLFHWLLSGQRSVEVTNASTTQMLDPRTKSWSTTILDAFNLSTSWFAEPTEAGTTIGSLQASVAESTGLGETSVIVPATHDTASAVLSVPAKEFAPSTPKWCYISSGTWSLMGVETNHPHLTDDCARLNFTNEGGVAGSTRLLKNIGGMWVFQQIRASLSRRGTPPEWADMVEQARRAAPFELLIDPDDPSLAAPTDMIDAIHDFASRTAQPVPTDHGTLFRGALEGLALRYRNCLANLELLTGDRIDTIHIVGGGSLNELLCQMTADACDRHVVAGPVEATAIGNLLVQMIGAGVIGSIDEARQVVRASFPTVDYEPQNAEAWHDPAQRFDAMSPALGLPSN
ncbi:MAG: rhamnulokinase family protein [Planctomycetota bacterium]